jgi:hypothetical protein
MMISIKFAELCLMALASNSAAQTVEPARGGCGEDLTDTPAVAGTPLNHPRRTRK